MRPRAARILWLIVFVVAWLLWRTDGLIAAVAALVLVKIVLAGHELATAGPPEDDDELT